MPISLPIRLLVVAMLMLSAGGGPTAAQETWRATQKSLRVGVLATAGAAHRLSLLEPFRLHMEDSLGLPVQLVPARDMRALIDAIVNARIDYAPLSASAFASGWALCRCLEPLAAPLAADGTNGYHAIAVARAGSGVARLVDLKDKPVVFSARQSVAGYLVPVAALRAEGIDPQTYFSGIGHAAGPVETVAAMLRGEAAAAFAWSSLAGVEADGYSRGTLASMVASGTVRMADLSVVWRSQLIPHPPQVVRANLPEDLKALLRATLFDLAASDTDAYDAIEPNFSGGFAAVSRDAYAPVMLAVAPR